jgi:hypothetical protein
VQPVDSGAAEHFVRMFHDAHPAAGPELNRAVLHSFDTAGVTITDHYAEARHRLAWLRSRQGPHAYRPTFRVPPRAPAMIAKSPDSGRKGAGQVSEIPLVGA